MQNGIESKSLEYCAKCESKLSSTNRVQRGIQRARALVKMQIHSGITTPLCVRSDYSPLNTTQGFAGNASKTLDIQSMHC